ncbi:hypothetical protein FQN60_008674 [Etheostoma spectabile]|uniref:Uncharacterized protein n=1 Tax=Etheostoma spectabile TaxID=54343 RepID=A0A5J5CJE0_9PERO|nr:hypothetical protein FQN60_008674 [Etheostoma spectabile]
MYHQGKLVESQPEGVTGHVNLGPFFVHYMESSEQQVLQPKPAKCTSLVQLFLSLAHRLEPSGQQGATMCWEGEHLSCSNVDVRPGAEEENRERGEACSLGPTGGWHCSSAIMGLVYGREGCRKEAAEIEGRERGIEKERERGVRLQSYPCGRDSRLALCLLGRERRRVKVELSIQSKRRWRYEARAWEEVAMTTLCPTSKKWAECR